MLATLLTQYYPDGSVVPLTSLQSVRDAFGRQPFVYVELDLDYCSNTYGIAPCTASIGTTGTQKCFNTLASCQAPADYVRTIKTYRFCMSNGGRVPEGLDAIPCLEGIGLTPAEIDTGNGLGLRALASITMRDFPHSDLRVDPYVSERAYIPLAQGSYFGRLRARNPYYNGRVMRIYSGYLTELGKFDPANFERKTYFMDGWVGVSADGLVKISGKDILRLAADDKAVFPRPSVGKLTLDISNVATSATITPLGVGDLDYPVAGYVRIGSEVMAYTRTGDVLTLDRGEGGTSASDHKQGDTVQLCGQFDGQKVHDIIYQLLTVGAKIDPVYIPYSDWASEQTAYLPRRYSALITAPTGTASLIAELAEQVGFFLFWDEVAEKIRFQSIRPNAGSDFIYELTPEQNILEDSLSVKDLSDSRLNEVWVYYGVIDTTKNLTESANYKIIHVGSDPSDQSEVKSNDLRIKKIYSRWISDINGAAATELATRYIKRYGKSPREASFALDAKDATITLADFVRVESRQNQDIYGNNESLLLQVIKRTESQQGSKYAITAREFAYEFGEIDTGLRVIEINADRTQINLRAAFDSLYDAPTGGLIVRFIIASGALLYSDDTAITAMTIGEWPAGVDITVINNGHHVGCGGDGGSGGVLLGFTGRNGGNALDGADGYPITYINNGILAGGGGGGGYYGPVYGGGGGAPYGAGGGAYDEPTPYDGQDGGRLTGGAGGSFFSLVTLGGKGGDIGLSGVSARFAGGLAGYAVINDSNITMINNGQIIGR